MSPGNTKQSPGGGKALDHAARVRRESGERGIRPAQLEVVAEEPGRRTNEQFLEIGRAPAGPESTGHLHAHEVETGTLGEALAIGGGPFDLPLIQVGEYGIEERKILSRSFRRQIPEVAVPPHGDVGSLPPRFPRVRGKIRRSLP